ncbi:MAG TPA: acetolactate synthase small subunit, partial [Streptosporangiaceae bacterium]|nr:acetolactate synthase small subunit [Streptosporangiaceae bacterium]
ELALIKVYADPGRRSQLLEVAQVFGATVVDMTPTTLMLEAVSSPGKLDALLAMLDTYGTCEIVRTGRVALGRGPEAITDDHDQLSTTPRSADQQVAAVTAA